MTRPCSQGEARKERERWAFMLAFLYLVFPLSLPFSISTSFLCLSVSVISLLCVYSYLLYGSLSSSSPSLPPLLREVTEVSPYALLFLGGGAQVDAIEAQYLQGTATIDTWIKFNVPGRVVALILSLRQSLDAFLQLKINQPYSQLHYNKDHQGGGSGGVDKDLISMIAELLSCE
jgi:hypothetical protein